MPTKRLNDLTFAYVKDKHIHAHMRSAFNYAECSTAERLKVGCVLVKNDRIISIGYNGMPSGWSNVCEESTLWLDGKQLPHPILITKPEVLHAEENAITKLAKSNESGEGAIAFITHAPCLSCAKLLYSSGIVEVYYAHEYRNTDGIDFLKWCMIKVTSTCE
jgi:dCMP deaminase